MCVLILPISRIIVALFRDLLSTTMLEDLLTSGFLFFGHTETHERPKDCEIQNVGHASGGMCMPPVSIQVSNLDYSIR